ncbi:MAG: Alpha/Beta hydrolase protein, partial [Monoraphidium minutum]
MEVISRDSGSYDMIGRWFDYAPIHEIKRDNVRDLLAYGFGYRPSSHFDAAGEGAVPDILLREIESVWGNPYGEGRNADLKYMAHLDEPLRALPKPLAWYALAEGLGGVKHAVLAAAGFACERQGGFTYYTYRLPARGAASPAAAAAHAAAPPLVFCHGVGLGLLPYVQFVLKLAALGRPVVAVEWPHLAMRWSTFIPTVDEVRTCVCCAGAILGILDAHAIPRAALVGHSFGTFFMSRLQRTAPHRVAAMAFLDPVCMCMWSGHLIRSFVYRPAATKGGLVTWAISRDIHTAAAVARNFFWSEYNMWPADFPAHSLVVLSAKDDLVPFRHVSSMVLHETAAALLVSPEDKHAGFLFNPTFQAKVVAGVHDLLEASSGAGGAAKRKSASPSASASAGDVSAFGVGGFTPGGGA